MMQALRWMMALLLLLPLPARAETPVLVMPLMKDNHGRYLLWEENNRWRLAWSRYVSTHGQAGVILPMGDLEDVQSATAEQVLAGDKDALAALAQRYKVNSVMVSQAVYQNGRLNLRVNNTDTDFSGKEAQAVTASLQDIRDQIAAEEVADIAPAAGGTSEGIQISDTHTLQAVFPVHDLAAWVKTREKLKTVPAVQGHKVLELSTSFVKLELTYSGTMDGFKEALKSGGFALEQQGSDWTLKQE